MIITSTLIPEPQKEIFQMKFDKNNRLHMALWCAAFPWITAFVRYTDGREVKPLFSLVFSIFLFVVIYWGTPYFDGSANKKKSEDEI